MHYLYSLYTIENTDFKSLNMKQADREYCFGKLAERLNLIKLELKRLMNHMNHEELGVIKTLISICKHLSSLRDDLLLFQEKYTVVRKKK